MSDRHSETEASVRSVLDTLWGIARGTIDNLRLSAAERLTLLLSAIAIAALATIFGTAVVFFLSLGAAKLLESVTPRFAYFIVSAFYAILLAAVLLFRRPLVVDPVARLITRLLVAPPDDITADTSTTNTPDHADDTPRQ
ncbi:MAG: hypothetical protein K2F97_03460 [Muribaculaceae bacterium]|nr:hypothetical protein [Muribaculaceae bacterium]